MSFPSRGMRNSRQANNIIVKLRFQDSRQANNILVKLRFQEQGSMIILCWRSHFYGCQWRSWRHWWRDLRKAIESTDEFSAFTCTNRSLDPFLWNSQYCSRFNNFHNETAHLRSLPSQGMRDSSQANDILERLRVWEEERRHWYGCQWRSWRCRHRAI